MAKTSKSKKNSTPAVPTLITENPLSPIEQGTGLQELFMDGIRGMYWTENHILKALPKMIAAADSTELATALTMHLEITREHVARLENAFELAGEKISAKKCDAMEGLAMDGEHIIESTVAGTDARDTGLIMAGRKVENYEMTAYNGLIELAVKLGKDEIANLLQENYDEEQEADNKLAAIANNNNPTE